VIRCEEKTVIADNGAEEEIFVVLAGKDAVRLGDERHPVRAGHVVAPW
jgi:uncharacterized cupin superfamily protein